FFSSRRRHTRSTRDWSSDVCSSDLVRQGDALLDPLALARSLAGGRGESGSRVELERLGTARRTLFGLAGPAKREALAELTRAEAALARTLFEDAIGRIDARLAALLAGARDRDLFGRRRGLDGAERTLLRRLRASRP